MPWPSFDRIGAHWRRRFTAPAAHGVQQPPPRPPGTQSGRSPAGDRTTPGDYTGPLPEIVYAPQADGRPDPGEVVWAWVPFQEDPSRGKDRPVLLIAWDGVWPLALPMTSKDHDRDAAQERAAGRIWVDIGSGAWDSRGRASEVGVHRVIRVDPAAIRREGAILARERFADVVAALMGVHGHQR